MPMRISDELPLIIPMDTTSIDDLPEYYEEVKRRERTGYSSQGVPQRRWRTYAVRPLSDGEKELLDKANHTN